MKRSISFAAAGLSGLIVGITILASELIPWAHALVFVCLVPLWAAWMMAGDGRKVFLTGWIAQFIFTLIGFNWVAHTVHEFSHLNWPVSILVLIFYCAVANIYLPVCGWLWWRIFSREKFSPPFRIAALVAMVALGGQFFPALFPWNFGYAWFYQGWIGFQAADLIGFQGLSGITLMVNGWLLLAALQFSGQKKKCAISISIAILTLLIVQGLGFWRASFLAEPNRSLRIMAVQANIGNKLKHLAQHGPLYQEAITKKFIDLTAEGLDTANVRPDLVVWPETSFPDFIYEKAPAEGPRKTLQDFLRSRSVNLLVGAYGEDEAGKVTNALYFLSAQGGFLAPPYHKSELLAFGEYIPGGELFPALKRWIPDIRDFGRGTGPVVKDMLGHKIGAQICYEGAFSWFSRDLASGGADIIVNVTNDSWYGDWQQPAQHLYLAMAKAVEVRRPLVRSTNTGFTAVALASGEIMDTSPLRQEWVHAYEVPYVGAARITPFTKFGYWLVPFLFFLGLGFIYLIGRESNGEGKSGPP